MFRYFSRALHTRSPLLSLSHKTSPTRKLIAANPAKLGNAVHAIATAESYDLGVLQSAIVRNNYEFCALKLPDELNGKVLRVGKSASSTLDDAPEAFVFAEGTVVCWNMNTETISSLLELVRPMQKTPYDADLVSTEREVMELETAPDAVSRLEGGRIVLRNLGDTTLLDRFAFSDGMALSVRLAILESTLQEYAAQMETLPVTLRARRPLKISMEEVQQRIGELMILRHSVNLASDNTDFYWDRPTAEQLYVRTCRFLDVPGRRAAINQRLTYCTELMELLRTIVSEKHSRKLEWYIIWLIAVEVVFGFWNLIEKYVH